MQVISNFLEQLKSDLAANMKNKGQDRKGKIGESLRVELTNTGGALYGWRWLLTRIEFGRGPTRNSAKGSPTLLERIQKWVEENNIGEPKKRKSIAYAITRKIHQSGDRQYRKQHPTLTTPSRTFYDLLNDGRIERLQQDIAFDLKAEILDIYKTMNHA